MKTGKIQSHQPSFGTRVRMSSVVANKIAANENYKEILKQIKTLEKNGKNDIFIITADNKCKGDNIKGELIEFSEDEYGRISYTRDLKYGDIELQEGLMELYEFASNPRAYFANRKKVKLVKGAEKLLEYII